MNQFKRILSSKQPDESIRNEIRENNIQRIIYFCILAIPVNIYHILLFYFNVEQSGTLKNMWRWGIIGTHAYSALFFLAIGFFFYSQKKKRKAGYRFIDFMFVLIFIHMIVLGIVLVVFDQIVTPAITPYLMLCAIISMIVLIPPRLFVPLFLISYMIFFYGISIYQKNPEVLLSNRVNGVSALTLGMLFSIIMWRNTVTRYRQRNIIEKQKQELEKKLIELKEANTSKDKLLGIIGHDLSTPFNLITGLTELLKENIHDYTIDQIEKYLSDIYKTALQTQSLLRELLIWARLQTGNIFFNPIPFDLISVVKHVADGLSPVLLTKRISIETEVNPSISVMADKEMVKTILRNLINNAIKYSYTDGIIYVRAYRTTTNVQVEVEDRGTGIILQKKELLFLPGEKSTPGTANEKGVGLGLVLCREFVEKHNGKIWVESDPGNGSKFIFTLPADQ
jgi:signal transduction histidine kinase